jgi:hypothetical protein
MSLTTIARRRHRKSTIVEIDLADYMDDLLMDDLLEREEILELHDHLERAHGRLCARDPNVLEALIFLERALALTGPAARRAKK